MADRPQNMEIQHGDISMYLYYSNFVKALRSLSTGINHFFEQILAQGENKGAENKKGNNLSKKCKQENPDDPEGNCLSTEKQNKTQITIKDNNPGIIKGGPVRNPTLKKR